jgi:thiol-disulfide isomerase/thioredoxin
MTPHRRNVVVAGLVAASALGAGALVAPLVLERSDSKAGALARARFADLQGKTRALSEWQGKVVVVNFWATWCAPCLEEMPLLMSVRKAQAGRGVEIVGIAVDQAAKVSEFAAKLKIDYPILLADTGGLDLIRSLGNKSAGLPFTVFLDRAGSVARTKLGILKQPELDSVLAALTAG